VAWVSYSYWPNFAWGAGYPGRLRGLGQCGSASNAGRSAERDWALCATWGMAVVIALGGILAQFHMANRPALILIAIAGCGFPGPLGVRATVIPAIA
jgi:hypothetical protein